MEKIRFGNSEIIKFDNAKIEIKNREKSSKVILLFGVPIMLFILFYFLYDLFFSSIVMINNVQNWAIIIGTVVIFYIGYIILLKRIFLISLRDNYLMIVLYTFIIITIILVIFYIGDNATPFFDITAYNQYLSRGIILFCIIISTNLFIVGISYREKIVVIQSKNKLNSHIYSSFILILLIVKRDISIKPSKKGNFQIIIRTPAIKDKRFFESLTEEELREENKLERKYTIGFCDPDTNPDHPKSKIISNLSKQECLDFIELLKQWGELEFIKEDPVKLILL